MKYTPSATNSVHTPKYLLDYIEKTYGSFYDPCPFCKNPTIDGLKSNWIKELQKRQKDIVYCNPPYSKGKRWLLKSNEYPDITVVYLIKNETLGSNYMRQLKKVDVVFLQPHITFPNYAHPARFSSLLLITGPTATNSVKFLSLESLA